MNIIFIIIVALNLLILMMRIMSDYAGSNSFEEQTSVFFKRNTSVAPLTVLPVDEHQSSAGDMPPKRGNTIGVASTPATEFPSTLSGFDSILNCHNQSKCIVPHLELNHDINVYFCKHTSRGRCIQNYTAQRTCVSAHFTSLRQDERPISLCESFSNLFCFPCFLFLVSFL